MLSHETFQKAIKESPDDVDLRLVYADWCDEDDDPRGEFIRVQCELAKPSKETNIPVLIQRQQELLDEYGKELFPELDDKAANIAIHHHLQRSDRERRERLFFDHLITIARRGCIERIMGGAETIRARIFELQELELPLHSLHCLGVDHNNLKAIFRQIHHWQIQELVLDAEPPNPFHGRREYIHNILNLLAEHRHKLQHLTALTVLNFNNAEHPLIYDEDEYWEDDEEEEEMDANTQNVTRDVFSIPMSVLTEGRADEWLELHDLTQDAISIEDIIAQLEDRTTFRDGDRPRSQLCDLDSLHNLLDVYRTQLTELRLINNQIYMEDYLEALTSANTLQSLRLIQCASNLVPDYDHISIDNITMRKQHMSDFPSLRHLLLSSGRQIGTADAYQEPTLVSAARAAGIKLRFQ